MDEEFVKELLSKAQETKVRHEKMGKKVPLSVSIPGPLRIRLRAVLGGASPTPVIEKLIEVFVIQAEEIKSRRS